MVDGGEEGSLDSHVAARVLLGSVDHLVRGFVGPDVGSGWTFVVPVSQRTIRDLGQLLGGGKFMLLGLLAAAVTRGVRGRVGGVGAAFSGSVVFLGGHVLGRSDE